MKYVFSLIFIALLLAACESEQTVDEMSTIPLVIEAQENLDPLSITYWFNEVRAENYLKQAESLIGVKKLNLLIRYSIEKINSGDTRTAINMLQKVLSDVEAAEVANKEKSLIAIKRILAIAYMRLGEQENCIQKHNHESCIVPIQSDGFHEIEEGSRVAIKYLQENLAVDPMNAEAIWILNLAYMTLGEYPDKVPPAFLLPPSYFTKNSDKISRFDNKASNMGIAHNLLSGGVIIEDFDNDDDLDIFCTSWGFSDEAIYYENDGKGGFSDKTKAMGLKGHTGGLNIKQTDFNNDGLIDIYIMRGAWMMEKGAIPNTLLENTGNGFKDVTLAVGLTKHSPTQACEWVDVNKDGWLDLFVFNESVNGGNYPTQLWINNKGENFQDVGQEAGLSHIGCFKGISVGDLNNDGWDEIYVSNLGAKNLFYLNKGLNENGVPVFVEVGERLKVTQPLYSFPTMMFDFNNDGFLDIIVSSFQSKIDNPAADFAMNIKGMSTGGETLVYINNGDGTFDEVHEKFGMNEAIYTMGCNFGDLNNDGWIDFYLGTGDPSFFSIVPNKVYLNDNGNNVYDVTHASGMAHIQKGHGVSMSDLDRDGHLDVYAVMGGAYAGDIFQNAFFHNPGNENNSVTLKLVGKSSNSLAIGAKLLITIEENGTERKLYRRIDSGASFGSNTMELLVGVGKAEKIKSIDILWPFQNAPLQRLTNLDVNAYHIIEEGKSEVITKKRNPVEFKLDKMHMH